MTDPGTPASDVVFGAWLQQRRKALDLTQDDLARRGGRSLSAIRQIENGKRRPSRQVAELLADHLRVAADQREIFLRVARAELRIDNVRAAWAIERGRLAAIGGAVGGEPGHVAAMTAIS